MKQCHHKFTNTPNKLRLISHREEIQPLNDLIVLIKQFTTPPRLVTDIRKALQRFAYLRDRTINIL